MPRRSLAVEPPMIDLYGYGRVGGALERLLGHHGRSLRSVTTSKGIVRGTARGPPSIVFDCTPPKYTGGEAVHWVCRLEGLLERGVHLVTCNKAPLAIAGRRLEESAARGKARILSSATVGGGTPVLPVLRRLDASLGVVRVQACASGTLGFVLDRVGKGESLDSAIAGAQAQGYAEPDPRFDLDGTDLAAKGVLLHNVLRNAPERTVDPEQAPFISLNAERIRRIAESGGVPRAIVNVERGRVEIRIQNAPWAAGAPENAVVCVEASGGAKFLIRGPGAGPRVTAANMLADLEDLLRG